MKESREYELGRSMTEMVGVLIVIAILTVASLTGLDFFMTSWRRHQTIDQVNALALGMRTGNVAARYGADERIPIKAVVQGLQTKTGMEDIAVLPDSSESYATVKSFGANQYMLEMDVTPGTCEEFLDKLMDAKESSRGLNPDIVKICTGTLDENGTCSNAQSLGDKYCESGSCTLTEVIADLKANEKNKENGEPADDVTKAQVLSSICTNRPKTALIWGCAEGAGNYFYHGECQNCPSSTPHWDGTTCCVALDPKTGLCPKACPDGTHWWAEGGKCVECYENSQCPDTIFSEHICDTASHTCVECLENRHCTASSENLASRTADASPRDADWRKNLCSSDGLHRCYECFKDDECPSNTVEVEGGRTVEWDSICLKDKYTCSPCVKNYQGNGIAEPGECPEDAPVCNNPGTSNATCSPCSAGQTWDGQKCSCPEDLVAVGGTCCPKDKPIVDDNGVCVKCIPWNDSNTSRRNEGCVNRNRLPGGRDTCIVDPYGTGGDDRDCFECRLNYSADDPNRIDRCNSADESLCKVPHNDAPKPYTDRDGLYTCFVCKNNKTTGTDAGCTDAKPNCKAEPNEWGNECEAVPVRTCKAYYYQPDGKTYEKMDDVKCKKYLGVNCNKYDGWTFKTIDSEPDACLADPCGGKYYDHDGTQMTAAEIKAAGATLKTCPLASVSSSAVWPKRCVCDLRCQNGYFEKKTDGTYQKLSSKICSTRVDGGCSVDTCKSLERNTVTYNGSKVKYACQCTVDHSCEGGYYTRIKVGNTYKYQKLSSSDKQCTSYETRSSIVYNGNTVNNVCICNTCSGCLYKDGTCMELKDMYSYSDLYPDDTGHCTCRGIIRTKSFSDLQGFDYNGRDRDKDKNCSRLQSNRHREYSVEVNFYCPRYMVVSDNMEADDFVYSSAPAGIGVTSPAVVDKTWVYAHTNRITPKVSSRTITKGAAKLVVSDRWLGEVGASGFFYFTDAWDGTGTKKTQNVKHVGKWVPNRTATGEESSKQQSKAGAKLGGFYMRDTKYKPAYGGRRYRIDGEYYLLPAVKIKWEKGSSPNGNVQNYVCKKGEHSTTGKDCDNYCNNWTGV